MRSGSRRCCTPSMPSSAAARPAFNGALALAGAMTIQAGIGIVTLLHQAPIALALLHQAMAIVVLTIAVVHAERHHAAQRLRCRATCSRSTLASAGIAMIELTRQGDVAVLKLAHGKANALDIELCEAIAAQFEALRDDAGRRPMVLTGQGRMFSAGVDLPRLIEGGARLCAAIPAGAAPALRHGVPSSQAGGRRGQRPRHRRRLRAGLLRRQAHRGARRRPHRRDRAAGRRAVSGDGVRGDALCHRAAISSRRDPAAARPFRPTRRSRAAWSTRWSSPAELMDRALAAARDAGRAAARDLRHDQAARSASR